MLSEFDGFLSGYPVVDIPYYALARTWAAPEKHRPGCVWTHTLLVHIRDLAILDVDELTGLFARPHGEPHRYSEPLGLNDSHAASSPPADPLQLDQSAIGAVIEAYYGSPRRPVLVIDGRTDRTEALVRAMFMQQWPRLRRQFTFALAGSGTRAFGSESFSLQLVTPQQLPLVRDDVGDANVVARTTAPQASWVRLAAQDTIDPVPAYREFLSQFGSEAEDARGVFQPLTSLYALAASGGDEVFAEAARLATSSPLGEPSRLTVDLFAEASTSFPDVRDVVRLRELARARVKIDPGLLDLPARVSRAIDGDLAGAVDLVVFAATGRGNQVKNEILDAAAHVDDVKFLKAIGREDGQVSNGSSS